MNFRRSIWVDSLLITAAAGIIQLLLFLYLDGGVIPFESNSFLLIYNEPRPLAQIIFDPRRTDWGLYQARELSYFFDALDARFIAWCIRAGIAHLLSLSTLFFMLGTVFLQQYAFRRHFPRLGAVAGLLSLLYVLTPCAFNPLFFRSAKPGTAFIITASLALATELLRRRRKSYAGWVGFAALLLLGCGFDRTGLLYASGCAMSGAALWILAAAGVFRVRPDGWRNLAVAALAAVLAATIYNLLLAPLLIQAFNGYQPDFSYQRLSGLPPEWLAALSFTFGNFGNAFSSFGGVPAALIGGVLALLFAVLMRRNRVLLTLWLAAFAATFAAAALMAARHPPLLDENVARGGYYLPFFTLLIFLLGIAAGQEKLARPAVLLAVVAGIILRLTIAHPAFSVPDARNPRKAATEAMVRALDDPDYDPYYPPLPYPSQVVVEFFRNRTDDGDGSIHRSNE